jgi:hypothetical protein
VPARRGGDDVHLGRVRLEHLTQSGAPQRGHRTLDRQHTGHRDVEDFAPPSVEATGGPDRSGWWPCRLGCRLDSWLDSWLDSDQAERLRCPQPVGQVSRHRPGAAIERVVAAQHDRRAVRVEALDLVGQRVGHLARLGIDGQIDTHHTRRPAGHRGAQGPFGTGRAGGHHHHRFATLLAQGEGHLERGPVGGRHPGKALVVGGIGPSEPLQAGDDAHVRRNTTPWPPSG